MVRLYILQAYTIDMGLWYIVLFSALTDHAILYLFKFHTANDDVPYRDVLVYINSTLQQGHHNNTNVTVDLGDSLTVAVRGVGNISMINASDPRFICETNFACNMQLRLSAVSNRGVECSLRTPVELSDNGRTLTVILSKMEQINITITGK